MSKTNAATNVTGRDDYIIAKALRYAIAIIQSLPEQDQEWSDMADMCDIHRAFFGTPVHAVSSVQAHTGLSLNLFVTKDDELEESDAFKTQKADFAERLAAWEAEKAKRLKDLMNNQPIRNSPDALDHPPHDSDSPDGVAFLTIAGVRA